MLTVKGEGAQVAARTPSVTKPSRTDQSANKAIVHSGTNNPACHVSRSLGGLAYGLSLVLSALALFVAVCVGAGALADYLPPIVTVICGVYFLAAVLVLVVWSETREDRP